MSNTAHNDAKKPRPIHRADYKLGMLPHNQHPKASNEQQVMLRIALGTIYILHRPQEV
jgi:hypothetical protein